MAAFSSLSISLRSDVIRRTFENAEPFLNISEQDGIYIYRIIIILKMLFALQTAEYTFPKYVTWLIFSISNAFILNKSSSIAILLAIALCFIVFAPSKKFALFTNMALICIMAMNIKSYELMLDLYVAISIITYACQMYTNGLQKFLSVVSVIIIIGCSVSNLHIFTLRYLSLIACFLLLVYILSKPDKQNKCRHRIFYFYIFMFVWMAYKYQFANFRELHSLIGNFELHKKWRYETNEVSSNIKNEKIVKTLWNHLNKSTSEAKITEKSIFSNLTCWNDIQENVCRINDVKSENSEFIDKNVKYASIYDVNFPRKKVVRNFGSKKLKFLHNCKNECSITGELNLHGDVNFPNTDINFKKFCDYFKKNTLTETVTHIEGETEQEKYNSNNKIFIKSGKEGSERTKHSQKYITEDDKTCEKFTQSNEINSPNMKEIKKGAIENEYNCFIDAQLDIDEKGGSVLNEVGKTRIEDISQDTPKHLQFLENKITSKNNKHEQNSEEESMQKFFKTMAVTEVPEPDCEHYLNECSTQTDDGNTREFEQLLEDMSKQDNLPKIYSENIYKTDGGNHVIENTNDHSSTEKDKAKTIGNKSKRLTLGDFYKSNIKSMSLKATALEKEIIMQSTLDSIQVDVTKTKERIKDVLSEKKTKEIVVISNERNVYKSATESEKSLVFNEPVKEILRKGGKWIRNIGSLLIKLFKAPELDKDGLVAKGEFNLKRSNLKKEIQTPITLFKKREVRSRRTYSSPQILEFKTLDSKKNTIQSPLSYSQKKYKYTKSTKYTKDREKYPNNFSPMKQKKFDGNFFSKDNVKIIKGHTYKYNKKSKAVFFSKDNVKRIKGNTDKYNKKIMQKSKKSFVRSNKY